MPSDSLPISRRSSLRERIRRQHEVAALLGIDDEDLATLIVTVDDPLHVAACEAIRQRSYSLLLKNARRICGHLGHSGRRCGGPGCDQAFNAAMGELATRIIGAKVSYAFVPGATFEECFYVNSADRRPRTTRPASATSRWLERPLARPGLSLSAAIGSELKAQGRFSDVRRRWNTDRGLKARINLPSPVAQNLRAALDRKLGVVGPEVRAVLESAVPKNNVVSWAERIYDDACDTSELTVGPDVLRIARAVGIASIEGRLHHVEATAIELVVTVMSEAADGYVLNQYLAPAYAISRTTAAGYQQSGRGQRRDDDKSGAEHGT